VLRVYCVEVLCHKPASLVADFGKLERLEISSHICFHLSPIVVLVMDDAWVSEGLITGSGRKWTEWSILVKLIICALRGVNNSKNASTISS
jgi:hypothetical protein